MAAITICSDFGAPQKQSLTVSMVSPSICHEVMGPDAMILVFWMLSFKPTFSLSSFTLRAFCYKGGVIYIFEVIDISPSNINLHNKGHIPQIHSKHYPQCWNPESISCKIRNKTRVLLLSLLFNIVLDFLNTEIRGKKEIKGIQIEKEVKLSLFADEWKSFNHIPLFETPWNSLGQNTGVGSPSLVLDLQMTWYYI